MKGAGGERHAAAHDKKPPYLKARSKDQSQKTAQRQIPREKTAQRQNGTDTK